MKTETNFRNQAAGSRDTEDLLRKAAKLDPIRKSGKDRHSLYSELDDEEDVELDYRKRESVLDYFDDGDEDTDE